MLAKKQWIIRARLLAAAFAATVLLTCCNPMPRSGPSTGTARSQGQVIALKTMSQLRTVFNRDQGHARLVLIFSPT